MAPEPVTAELTYQRLKREVMHGRFRPGTPVISHSIAQEFGTSISPVRDAMQRLAAERLLHHQAGGGFEVPHFDASALTNLYAWHQDVVRLALRDRDSGVDADDLLPRLLALRDDDPEALVQATSDLFAVVGRSSRNGEHGAAIEAIGSRLHLARLHEFQLGDRSAELMTVWSALAAGPASTAIAAIRAYHRRRLRRVPAIVRAIYVP